jgi:hypothetical protein
VAEQLAVHQPCEDCGSSDALAVYDWGSKCYACGTTKKMNTNNEFKPQLTTVKTTMTNIHDIMYSSVSERGLTRDTCLTYGIGVKDSQYYFPYYGGDSLVAYKKRSQADKKFSIEGAWKEGGLFGQQLFSKGGKYVTITEGEFDAAAAYQMLGSSILSSLLGTVQRVQSLIARRNMNGWIRSRILLSALIMMNQVELLLTKWLKSLELKPRSLKEPKTAKTPATTRRKTKAKNS